MKKRERNKDFGSSDLPATYPALWRDGVKQRGGRYFFLVCFLFARYCLYLASCFGKTFTHFN